MDEIGCGIFLNLAKLTKIRLNMKRFFCFLMCISGFLFSDMPEPYRSINDLPFDEHGWFGNAQQLEGIIAAKSPKTVIEIGSWLGASTRFIASHLPKEGILYAIDTWRGSPTEPWHMQDPRLPYLYQLFLSNVKHANLTDKIIPIRMNSLEAATALNIKADLIYLDASHEKEDVINDIMYWSPHLNPNGTLCGDDYWTFGTVRDAVNHCASILNKKVSVIGNFWFFE